MSKRLQVLLEDSELRELRQVARRHGLTVAEWVRRALRVARRQAPLLETDRKVGAVRSAIGHGFPTAEIEQILAEIESGYSGEPHG